MVILLMGAAGAGKTTVGRRLAEDLTWTFVDGDTFHSPENIAKMARGLPLTDEDRRPWLDHLRRSFVEWVTHDLNVVVACSLLKRSYRAAVLKGYEKKVRLVYLQAAPSLLRRRLSGRTGHFAGAELLESQLSILEKPESALVLDASLKPEQLVRDIRDALSL
jgi:gluconokinase